MSESQCFYPYWPRDVDGVDKYPQYHRERKLNDLQGWRVVDVLIPADTAEEPHTHAMPSYMLIDSPASITVHLVDKDSKLKLVHRNDTEREPQRLRSMIVQAMDPEPLHFVTNTQKNKDYRATRFELVERKDLPTDAVVSLAAARIVSPQPAAKLVKVDLAGANPALARVSHISRLSVPAQTSVAIKHGGFLVEETPLSQPGVGVSCRCEGASSSTSEETSPALLPIPGDCTDRPRIWFTELKTLRLWNSADHQIDVLLLAVAAT